MAESSEIVTPDRRFTDCGLVRDCSCSTPRLTPPATSAASTTTPATTMTGLQRPRLFARVPGQDELPVGLETGGAVEPDCGLVVGPRPDVTKRDAALAEEPDSLVYEHLPDAPAAMFWRYINLGDLALETRARVEEDEPAEADHVTDLVANAEDDVLSPKVRGHRRKVVFDLFAPELGMV